MKRIVLASLAPMIIATSITSPMFAHAQTHERPSLLGINRRESLPDEERVQLPSGSKIYLRQIKEHWEVGVIDKNGKRFFLFNARDIHTVSEFLQGPTATTRPWAPFPIMNGGQLAEATTWFLVGTELGYQVIRYTGKSVSPYVSVALPGSGKRPHKFSSSQTMTGAGMFFVISVAEEKGEATYLIRASDGSAEKIASKFIELDEKGSSLIESAGTEVSFKRAPGLKINVAQFQGHDSAPLTFMVPIEDAGNPHAQAQAAERIRQTSQAIVEGVKRDLHAASSGQAPPQGDGGTQSPPAGAHKTAAAVNSQATSDTRIDFDYAETRYTLYSIAKGDKAGTYLQRESDQLTVKLTPTAVQMDPVNAGKSHSPTIEDGILKHPNVPREIDLDAFEMETKFTPSAHSPEIQWMTEEFQDVRRDGEVRIKASSGRKELISQVTNRLLAPSKSSIALYGEAGDLEIVMREAFDQLPRTWRINLMDATTVGSDIGVIGEFEKKVEKMKDASKTVPIIWFAPDLVNFVGLGKTKDGPKDFFDLVKRDMTKGNFRIAGTNDPALFERLKDPAVLTALEAKEALRLSEAEVLESIKNWLESKPNYPKPADEILRYVLQTAEDFKPTEGEPTRSITLLENIFSTLEAQGKLEKAGESHLTRKDVDQAATRLYSMPPEMRDLNLQRLRMRNLGPAMKSRVIGHEHIMSELLEATEIALSGLHDGRGPIMSFFLDGPPGTGKTEIAMVYAEERGLPIEVIEMAQFDGVNAGASELMGRIANAMKRNPFTVIVFDEIEKANPKVLESLLTAMSKPTFTFFEDLGEGRKRSVRSSIKNATVFMTSNSVGDIIAEFVNQMYAEEAMRTGKAIEDIDFTAQELDEAFWKRYKRDQIIDEIKKKVPWPLLDRAKVLAMTYPPSFEGLKAILKLKLKGVNKDVNKQMRIDAVFKAANTYLHRLVTKARREGWSTRTVISSLQKYVSLRAASLKRDDSFEEGNRYKVNLLHDREQVSERACRMLFK